LGTIVYVFAATDLFLFYVAFEVMLIPVYFLIGMFGRGQRSYAAVKFLLYSLLGGLVLLAALIGLYVVSAQELGTGTFDWTLLAGMPIDQDTQKLLFAGFFFAFAVKAPMFPVHTWLPDAAASGTAATNTLLVGVLDKVATFAMLRLVLPIFPDASQWAAPFVVLLAVVSIVYGALVAIGQTDMNRLIAYTSVSHFGFMVLGIFAFTEIAGSGSVVYMLAHGLSTAALFIGAEYLVKSDRCLRWRPTGGTDAGRALPVRWVVRSGDAGAGQLRRRADGTHRLLPALAGGRGGRGDRDRAVGAVHLADVPARGSRPGYRRRQGHARRGSP
jgi:NADH-quinone oxidoreductase subunit M